MGLVSFTEDESSTYRIHIFIGVVHEVVKILSINLFVCLSAEY